MHSGNRETFFHTCSIFLPAHKSANQPEYFHSLSCPHFVYKILTFYMYFIYLVLFTILAQNVTILNYNISKSIYVVYQHMFLKNSSEQFSLLCFLFFQVSFQHDMNLNKTVTWFIKRKDKNKPTAIPFLYSPPQDSEGLPDISWPASDLAAEHGGETQQQEVLHWVGDVSGPRRCPGGRVSQHAGGSQVPACGQRHLPGRTRKYSLYAPKSARSK